MPPQDTAQPNISPLLESENQQKLRDDLADIILRDDAKRALELVKPLQRIIRVHGQRLQQYPGVFELYHKTLIKAQFIALPLLDTGDVLQLLRERFLWQFRIDNYDIVSKVEQRLANIEVIADRDQFKQDLRKALLANNEVITSQMERTRVHEWLKDYTAHLGNDPADTVKRSQYLTDLQQNEQLQQQGYLQRLVTLFNLYEMLKYPSSSPQGFEESYLFTFEGKQYLFEKGRLQELNGLNQSEFTKVQGILQSAGTGEARGTTVATAPQTAGQSAAVVDQAAQQPSERAQLEQLREQYAPDSIERRAIDEELAHLDKDSSA